MTLDFSVHAHKGNICMTQSLYHGYFFIFISVECDFSDGDVLNNGPKIEELIGKTNTENECARSVKHLMTTATGALWQRHSKMCFAEFGDKINPPSSTWNHENDVSRACLFPGTHMNIILKSHCLRYFHILYLRYHL